MHLISWRALACACATLWTYGAAAQAAAAAESAPSFPELFRQAERTAPRLLEAEANVAAAQGRSQQAAAWANPLLGVEVEDVAGSGPYRGSSQAQTTVSIGQPLELGGQRGSRAAAGQSRTPSATRSGLSY